MKSYLTKFATINKLHKFNGVNNMRPIKFNKKVWAALKLIPCGRVTTYKKIAKYLGKPKAARAVGNALNKNPGAPGVPCHRVVRSDGQIGGYALGKRKKVELLKREKIDIKRDKIINFSKFFLRLK